MKAVVVTPYYLPKMGGLEVFAHQLNVALKTRKNWEIVVVTSNHLGRQTVREEMDGMVVYRLGTWFKFSNTPLNPLWPFMMRRLFRQEKPDVIMAHTPVPSLADSARLAAGKRPFVVLYHAATLLKGDSVIFDTIARLYQRYERALFRRADLICAVSEFVKQQFPTQFQSKAVVVPNAVWERQIVMREQPKHPNFLFVGSLDKTHGWKGLSLIIEAIARCRTTYGDDATLTVMGDGNNREQYKQLASSLEISEYVTFLGNKTGDEKEAGFRSSMALVVYPTSANDAFPTVMLEAWARSVPVIAAEIGPLPSLVKDEQDGYLVEPRNVDALAEKLHEVAHLEPRIRELLAHRAQQRTREHYTWEKQAELVDRLVRGLL